MNLGENAARHATHSENGLLTVKARIENGQLNIRIADKGSGIPPESQAHLLRSFASPGKNKLGIGLALSRELARAHGGNLRLEKTDATGTVFVLTLKICKR